MSQKPKCSATTKKGKPCRGTPISATDFKTCLAHAPEEVRTSLNFQQGPRPGRPAKPKPTDVARKLVEDHIEVTLAPHFRTLGYDIVRGANGELALQASENGGAKVLGESKDGEVKGSAFDDLGAQLAAAEKLLDRIYGRPKQTAELTGDGGGPIETRELVPGDADFQTEVARVLEEAEAIKGA